tara:strand:+ start:2805 stop:3230 length:426 start_codon:yes stop_codon:yes gene_type:complete
VILIAHRGNIKGVDKRENMPEYITEALNREYDVEIDVWLTNQGYFLGHDKPQYAIPKNFLRQSGVWCHAKNSHAFKDMLQDPNIHCFWHENDDYTLTSQGKIWIFPDKEPLDGGILVLREGQKISHPNLGGICSDFVGDYR